MIIKTSKLIYIYLYLYFSFLIINGFKIDALHIIGQYGKLSIAIISTITFSLIFPIKKLKNLKQIFYSLLIIFFLFNIFSIKYYEQIGINAFFYTITLTIYIIFFYFISNQLVVIYNKKALYMFFYFSEKILFTNFVLWFIISLIFNFNMFIVSSHGILKFGGFYGISMLFGLLCAFGYIISFYLYSISKNKRHLILMIIYSIFSFLSYSRTSWIIIITLTLYYNISDIYKRYMIIIISTIIIYFQNFFNDFNQLTSGRLYIWELVLKEMSNNIFIGHGIFNFHEPFLKKYHDYSNFFKISDSVNFHSSILEIYTAGGIIALILFIYINSIIYLHSSHLLKSIQISILTGAMFEGFILGPSFPISSLYWFTLIIQSFFIFKKERKVDS